jgi:nitrogen regulatory protein PII
LNGKGIEAMKLITAVVRSICLEKVITGLNEIGVNGFTVFQVEGRGEEIVLYRHFSVHARIEIIVSDQEVDKVRKTILDLTQTGDRGDGIITVQEIKELTRIRTRETVKSAGE